MNESEKKDLPPHERFPNLDLSPPGCERHSISSTDCGECLDNRMWNEAVLADSLADAMCERDKASSQVTKLQTVIEDVLREVEMRLTRVTPLGVAAALAEAHQVVDTIKNES